MARGRMLSKTISTSVRFNALTDTVPALAEFAQGLFFMLVVHCDDFGREEGDALTVKYKFHPRSPRPAEDFGAALDALDQVGLIQLYEVENKRYYQIQKFEQHQTGLHKRTRSHFPDPPPGGSGKFRDIPGQRNVTERNVSTDQEQRSALRSLKDVRSHLRAALHQKLNDNPDTPISELAALVKDLSRVLRFTWNTPDEITALIEGVLGQREKARTG